MRVGDLMPLKPLDPAVDVRTQNLQLPLPNELNRFKVDVGRIAGSFILLDLAIAQLCQQSSNQNTEFLELTDRVLQIQDQLNLVIEQLSTITQLLEQKVNSEQVDPAGSALALSIALG